MIAVLAVATHGWALTGASVAARFALPWRGRTSYSMGMTRALGTTSRMPFALDEIRKLGEAGHPVVATDTFDGAPGSHSRWVDLMAGYFFDICWDGEIE